MAVMTATTAATWLPEIWSTLASVTYRTNIVLPALMDRRWEKEVTARGDTVNIPAFSQNATATARSTFGTEASLTFDNVTESQIQLLVNKMAYKAFAIPVELTLQIMDPYVRYLIEGAGQACSIYVDNQLSADDSNGLDALTAIGVDNAPITEDLILQADELMSGQNAGATFSASAINAPRDDRFLVVSPYTLTDMKQIEVFRNQLYAASTGTLPPGKGRGYVGHVHSFDVYESTNLEGGTSGTKCAAFHREAIALAMQQEPKMVSTLNIRDGITQEYAAFVVFGHKLVKSNFGREIDAR